MCGIAGLLGTQAFYGGETLQAMTEALRHRGPDGAGHIALNPGLPRSGAAPTQAEDCAARIWLGHRRLSIIDLAGSHQPLANEDGSVWVVFNGEIYNYPDLRRELVKRGHTLKTAGDTEVLPHLWEDYGEAMVERLWGMFAFALYDVRQNLLFLARDRFGKKPLYYTHTPDRLAFASELAGLKKIQQFPLGQVDSIAAAQYFRYGYIPSPRTIYPGVHSLPPGHFALLRQGRLTVKEYWRPRVNGTESNIDYDDLETLLDEAVRIRLRSDVPLGAFLSGGIDSSLVVASMARQMDRPVETFTISTGQSWCDESETARLTANHLGANHHTFLVQPDLVGAAEQLAPHFGQPFADYSSVPTYYVSRETRKHVTVALSGDGGDELFAGYERYTNARWSRLIGVAPYILRQGLAQIIGACGPRRRNLGSRLKDFVLSAGDIPHKGENHSTQFHRYWRDKGFQDGFADSVQDSGTLEIERFYGYYREAESPNPLERWLEADQRLYLTDDILVKVDIASMAVSLETRAPLLDHRFAEFSNRISINQKIKNGLTKAPLRHIAGRRVPRHIINLPKKGFTLPLALWLRKDLRDWANDVLFSTPMAWNSYLQPFMVQRLWAEHQTGAADHGMRLWMVLAWTLWWRSDK